MTTDGPCTQALELTYTNDDDGVWVECPNNHHRWKALLGWGATAADLEEAQSDHDNERL